MTEDEIVAFHTMRVAHRRFVAQEQRAKRAQLALDLAREAETRARREFKDAQAYLINLMSKEYARD